LEYQKNILKVIDYLKAKGPLVTIIFGRIGVAICGVLAVKISTVILKPAQLGSIAELNSLVYFFLISLIIPVTHFITRGFLEWNDLGTLDIISKKYFKFILLIAVSAAIVSGFIQWQWNLIKGFSIGAVFIFVLANLIFQPLNGFGASGLNLFGLRKSNVFFTNLVAWSSIAFSVLFFWLAPSIVSWGAGQILGFILGSSSIFFLWKRVNKVNSIADINQENTIVFNRKSVISFSWPFIFTSSLWWLQTQSYRFILGQGHGLDNVGLFVTAYALAATPIMTYEGVITQYLEPNFFKNLKYQGKEGQVIAWNHYAKLFLPGMAVISVYVAVSAPFLAKIFLGEAYRSVALKITGLAAIIEATRAAGTMMFQLGMAKLDNKMTILPAATGALSAPVAVYFLSKIDPLYGTIGGLFLAGIIVLCTNVFLSFKVLPITWPIKRILFGLLLSIPVYFALPIIHHFIPKPGYLLSFMVLGGAAIYIGGVVMVLLSSKVIRY
jgi:O-antigen/teichoic acid export membrane protein